MNTEIRTERIEDLLFCETKPVLEIKIEYPQIYGKISGYCENRFNSYYMKNAEKINSTVRKTFFKKACDSFKNSEKNGFPFNFMTFERTVNTSEINQNYISIYFDTYKYEGGAHGMTVRTSNTWSADNGNILPLGSFFVKGFNYLQYIPKLISDLISEDLKENDSVYYKNAPERCKRFFDEKRYYLSDTGFIFFYPSYSIAPYYAGIRLFEIPFERFGNKLKYIPNRMN
jgi:hypothetical protein